VIVLDKCFTQDIVRECVCWEKTVYLFNGDFLHYGMMNHHNMQDDVMFPLALMC